MDCGAHRLGDAGPVVGMDLIEEGARRLPGPSVGAVPRWGSLRVPGSLVRLQVPAPGDHAGGLESHSKLLSTLSQGFVGPGPLGDVALSAPGSIQQTVLDDADQVVQEVAVAAVPSALVGLRLDQSITTADEGTQEIEVLGIGWIEEIGQPGSRDLCGGLKAVHPSHRIIGFGEVGGSHEPAYLLVHGKLDRDWLLQLHSPDPFSSLLDEGTVALLAFPHGLFGAARVGQIHHDDPYALHPTGGATDRVVAGTPEPVLAGEASCLALQLDIDERLSSGQHLAVQRLQVIGEVGDNVAETFAYVGLRRQSIDGGECSVDAEETEIPVPQPNPIGSGLEQF